MFKLRLVFLTVVAFAALNAISPRTLQAQVFTISGTVTNTLGAPMAAADVFFFDGAGNPIGIPPTVTDIAGSYMIANVPNGVWGVKIEPRSVDKVLPLLQNVTVAGANAILNFVLPPGNLISGFVRDINGNPLVGIDLNVKDRNSGDLLDTPGDNTDIFGFYDIVIPDGRYRIFYRPVNGEPFLPFVINDITITNDTTIDVTLFIAATFSGRLLSNRGRPVINADLDFIDVTTGQVIITPGDKTDFGGNYSVTVPVGVYDIQFEPLVSSRMIAKEILAVAIPGDIQMDVTVDSGMFVSGFVRNTSGVGVAGADFDARDITTGIKVFTPFDNTDATGHYGVIIPSGTFDLAFQPVLASRLAPVELLSQMITNDVIFDITVPNGVILSTSVFDDVGSPLAGVDIDLVDAGSGVKVALVGDKTATDGSVSVVSVPSTYFLEIQPPLAMRRVAERLANVVLISDLTVPDFNLSPGVLLSGIISDSLGTPVANASIQAVLAPFSESIFTPANESDQFGHYEVVVPTGVYSLKFVPDSLSSITDTIMLSGVAINVDTTINVSFQSSMPGCCVGFAGNVDNGPGDITDITDLTVLIDHLFINFPPLVCPAEANIDGDPAGIVDITDLTALIDHLFINFPPTASCL